MSNRIFDSRPDVFVRVISHNFLAGQLRPFSLDYTISGLDRSIVNFASDRMMAGYPGVPLVSLAKACEIAQPGETIVVRRGVYRDVLAPKNDGATVRAMQARKSRSVEPTSARADLEMKGPVDRDQNGSLRIDSLVIRATLPTTVSQSVV